MIKIKTLCLCPNSWNILFLLSEDNINFDAQLLSISATHGPEIENYPSHTSYIFENFEKIIKNTDKKTFGFWFDEVMCNLNPNIIFPIRNERFTKPLVKRINPNLDILKEKRIELKMFLQKTSKTLEKNGWLDNDYFSCCDVMLASSIAVLDFLGEINWKKEKTLHDWYSKIKSRPGFKIILQQVCPGMKAHKNFPKIDF